MVELLAQKAAFEAEMVSLLAQSKEAEEIVKKSGQAIGNIVHDSVPVSNTEVSLALRLWRSLKS